MKSKCKFCEKEFSSKRSTARFCSENHRMAYHRKKNELIKLAAQAMYLMSKMETISNKFPELGASFQFKAIFDVAKWELQDSTNRELGIAKDVPLPL